MSVPPRGSIGSMAALSSSGSSRPDTHPSSGVHTSWSNSTTSSRSPRCSESASSRSPRLVYAIRPSARIDPDRSTTTVRSSGWRGGVAPWTVSAKASCPCAIGSADAWTANISPDATSGRSKLK